MAQADGRAVRGYSRTASPGPLLTVWLPAAPTRSTKSPVQTQRTRTPERADTDAGHRTSTPGHWTPNVWTSHSGHWTATLDTGHRTLGRVDATEYADSRQGTAGIRTDILDHHDQRTARWDAEPWTCGRHVRHSATMTARRGWVSASARLSTALPGACSVAPSAKPRLGALLSSERVGSRVERQALGQVLWQVQIRTAERLLGQLGGEFASRKTDVAYRAAA